jgi:hypothetical protein
MIERTSSESIAETMLRKCDLEGVQVVDEQLTISVKGVWKLGAGCQRRWLAATHPTFQASSVSVGNADDDQIDPRCDVKLAGGKGD